MASRNIQHSPKEETDEERQRRLEKKKIIQYNNTSCSNMIMILLLFSGVFIVTFTVLAMKTHSKDKIHRIKRDTRKQSTVPPGFGSSVGAGIISPAESLFIDQDGLNNVLDILTATTNGCTPPPSSPIFTSNSVQFGDSVSTNAAWQAIKSSVFPACFFYGLQVMEIRANDMEGPLEFCEAYVYMGAQILRTNYKGVSNPPVVNALLNTILPNLYPLNIWFDIMPSSYFSIIGVLQGHIDSFQSGQNLNVTDHAISICSNYFGTDNPAFKPHLLAWLGFPFEGMLRKTTTTFLPPAISDILGEMDPPSTLHFKNIFTTGTVDSPILELLFDAIARILPVKNIGLDPRSSIDSIISSITLDNFLNESLTPAIVIGRLADGVDFWTQAELEGYGLYYMLTSDGYPDNNINFPALAVRNAPSNQIMGVLDITVDHPIEDVFDETYLTIKAVADTITQIIGVSTLITATTSVGILDTFMLKNVIVNSNDYGGHQRQKAALQSFKNSNISTGLLMDSLPMQYYKDNLFPLGSSLSSSSSLVNLPDKWDWTEKRPECMSRFSNQQGCANCWIIASADAVSMNTCIKYGVDINKVQISSQYMTNCLSYAIKPCQPGYLDLAATFMAGAMQSTECMPFVLTGNPKLDDYTCFTKTCGKTQNGAQIDVGYLNANLGTISGSFQWIVSGNSSILKAAVIDYGMITIAYMITVDFKAWWDSGAVGVFTPRLTSTGKIDPSRFTGEGHANVLMGFDKINGIPVWKIKNSWTRAGYAYVAILTPAQYDGVLWISNYAAYVIPRKPTLKQATPSSTTSDGIVNGVPTTVTQTVPAGCPTLIVNSQQNTATQNIAGCPANTVVEEEKAAAKQEQQMKDPLSTITSSASSSGANTVLVCIILVIHVIVTINI